MTDIVPADEIEEIVGLTRHPTRHYVRHDTESGIAWMLHSQECFNTGIDLRDCPHSHALTGADWVGMVDRPVEVTADGHLAEVTP